MTPLVLTLALVCAADESDKPRKPSGIAPSLRALTRAEEDKLDAIIDRFIQADTGRLRGLEASRATREFEKLGYDAIPALIRGLNKAATINHSCPVLTISEKLTKLLGGCNDPTLLEFARDEIGAGVGRTRYSGRLQDLRFRCLMRKNALARAGITTYRAPGTTASAAAPTPAKLSTSELLKGISTQRGPALRGLLVELEKRSGKDVLDGLNLAAGSSEQDDQKLARGLLDSHLGRQTATSIKPLLTDERVEVRKAAVRVAAARHPTLVPLVIDCVTDADSGVRWEARQALVKLSKGEDFGPTLDADDGARRHSRKRWLAWWEKQR
jgi:hypothetical protein